MSNVIPLSEQYRQRLRQASWRIQYRTKARLYHESLSLKEEIFHCTIQSDDMNHIVLQEWINSLSSQQARTIMTGLYMEGQSEQEIASRLQMSQQAVNRWKRKSLQQLSQTSNS